jgi:nicotinamidase-related amidase
MPLDLPPLLSPAHTALVTQEIQRGVIGDLSALPELAKEGRRVVPNIARLCAAARARGVRVIHCTAVHRADGFGGNKNARLFSYMAKAGNKLVIGSPAAEIVPELAVAESDLVLARIHGLSPFQGTELDFVLRNEGIRTIVGVGVSLNVAIQNLTFDAVNAGYQVVLPTDAIAGTPREYAEQVLKHTLRNVATLATTDEVIAAWGRA